MFNLIKIIIREYKRESGKNNYLKALRYYFVNNSFHVSCYVQFLLSLNYYQLRYFLSARLERKFGFLLGNHAAIGKGLKILHYEGTIIGDKVKIGENCNIYQQVTLGQKNGKYPTIGDNVILYPGCKVIGNISIGNNVIIAPNAVVIHDIPDNRIAVGIPARVIIKKDEADE